MKTHRPPFAPKPSLRSRYDTALAALAGGVLVLALPPFNYYFLTPFVLSALLTLLVRQTTLGQAFRIGLAGGFTFFLGGTYWVNNALLLDPMYYWVVIPATLFIPLILALFWAVPSAVTWRFSRSFTNAPPMAIILIWAVTLVIGEVGRTFILLPFPWNPFGLTIMGVLPLLQVAHWVGSFGLSFLVILVGSSFYQRALALPWTINKSYPRPRYRVVAYLLYPPLWACVITLALFSLGTQRLQNNPTVFGETRVLLVQPNLQQKIFTTGPERTGNFFSLMALTLNSLPEGDRVALEATPGDQSTASSPPLPPSPLLIVWPEGGIPYDISMHPKLLTWVQARLPSHAVLVTGANHSVHGNHGMGLMAMFNSLLVITSQNGIVDVYHKHHLVPFGEYIPLSSLLSRILPMSAITGEGLDFSAGPGPTTISMPKGLSPISPSICYEAIFPQHDPTRCLTPEGKPQEKPKVIINITNDAWFGEHTGPHQHLAMARLRSIEQGLPTLRVAVTGITGIIDAYGRVVDSLPLGTRGVITGRIPHIVQAPGL